MAKSLNDLKEILSRYSTTTFDIEQIVFKTRAHQIILRFLDFKFNLGDKAIIQAALNCVSNLLLCSRESIDLFISMGILPMLHNYLDIGKPKWLSCIYWGLANIIGEDIKYRPVIIQNGFLDFLMVNFEVLANLPMFRKVISWFLGNLLKSNENSKEPHHRPLDNSISFPIIAKIMTFFNDPKTEEFTEALWSISFFLTDSTDLVTKTNFLDSLNFQCKINEFISKTKVVHAQPLVRIFGKFSFCTANIVERFDMVKAKDFLFNLVNGFNNISVQADSLWTISNFILTSNQLSSFFYSDDFFKRLQNIICDDRVHPRLKMESLQVLNSFFKMQNQFAKEKMIFQLGLVNVVMFSLGIDSLNLVQTAIIVLEEILEYGEKNYNRR